MEYFMESVLYSMWVQVVINVWVRIQSHVHASVIDLLSLHVLFSQYRITGQLMIL